jgi:hypothetical protein
MTTPLTEAVAPPKTSAERGTYTEQLHVLVDEPTRHYVLGLADSVAREAGYRFLRQGEAVRSLLSEALVARYEADPEAYARLVLRGRQIAAETADGTTPRRA